MGWAIGYDSNWDRDVGYGVPAICDAPGCSREINRGLIHVCGGEPYGDVYGCGLFFCLDHLRYRWFPLPGLYKRVCKRCEHYKPPYKRPKADTAEWINHKLTDESWAEWRNDNPTKVAEMQEVMK